MPAGMLIGGLLQWILLIRMGRPHLANGWLVGFLCFLIPTTLLYGWLGLLSPPVFWSGCTALIAVYGIWRYIQQVYLGAVQRRVLLLSALACSLTCLLSIIAGGWLTFAIGIFSVLHSVLHEREEKGTSYTQVSNAAVFHRWRKRWGVYWLLPFVAANAIGALCLGLWGNGSLVWHPLAMGLGDPHGIPVGYFATFHQEFQRILNPTLGTASGSASDTKGLRVLAAMGLSLLGVLPIVGILGMGYQVPNRFVYRFLQRPDEELLLLWLSATGLILATLFQSDSAHIVQWGSLSWLLGFVVLARWLSRRPQIERQFRRLLFWLLVWVLAVLTLSLG